MAIHHHVAHHTRRVVHHLRERPVEDRKAVAFVVAIATVGVLLALWMLWVSYATSLSAQSSQAASAAQALAESATSTDQSIVTEIDSAIYVKIPGEQ